MNGFSCRAFWLCNFSVMLFLCAALPSPAVAQGPPPLRVLTWNLHHGEGVDGKLDLERIADRIRDVRADVVALQEVEQVTGRTGRVDQPAELGRLCGLSHVFGKNLDFQGGGYGNAVLSRFPIRSSYNRRLPIVNNGEPRGVLVVELEIPGLPLPCTLLCTHLDHRPADAERRLAAGVIQELATTGTTAPMLLAGDLNDTPESPVFKLFLQDWQWLQSGPLPTIPVARPQQQIDFILTRPLNRWKLRDVQVLDEAVASDHRPLLMVLEWQ